MAQTNCAWLHVFRHAQLARTALWDTIHPRTRAGGRNQSRDCCVCVGYTRFAGLGNGAISRTFPGSLGLTQHENTILENYYRQLNKAIKNQRSCPRNNIAEENYDTNDLFKSSCGGILCYKEPNNGSFSSQETSGG